MTLSAVDMATVSIWILVRRTSTAKLSCALMTMMNWYVSVSIRKLIRCHDVVSILDGPGRYMYM